MNVDAHLIEPHDILNVKLNDESNVMLMLFVLGHLLALNDELGRVLSLYSEVQRAQVGLLGQRQQGADALVGLFQPPPPQQPQSTGMFFLFLFLIPFFIYLYF